MKKIDSSRAERMIEDYLEKHPGPNFASEIACALGFELEVTFRLVNKLLEEGRIKKTKRKLRRQEHCCEYSSREVIYHVQIVTC